MVFDDEPCHPQDDAHAFLPAVTDKFVHVDGRVGGVGVAGAAGPAFVHDDVRDAVLGGEVDVVFVSRRVESGDEIHVGAVGRCGVPEFPADLPGLDPRGIGDGLLFGEACGHRILDELSVVFRNDEIAPGKCPRAFCTGDVIGFLQDAHAPVARLFIGQGNLREGALHAVGAVPFEEHAGVVGQRRFAQQEFVALPSVDKHRQDGHRIARFPPVGLDEAVRLFISGLETARLLHHCGVVIREADGHLFGKHLDVVPEGGDEAVCHAVVVGTEFHGPATPEVEAEHVAPVADLFELECHDGAEGTVYRACLMTGEVRLLAQGALPQAKRQRTVRQERLAASVNRITYLFPDVDGDGDLPGRRF